MSRGLRIGNKVGYPVIKTKQYDLSSVHITPSNSTQTIIAPSGTAYNEVIVDAVPASVDQNIIPENIKPGVTIMGVEGTAGTNERYIAKAVSNDTTLINGSTIMDFSGVVTIGEYLLYHAYYYNTNITGELVFPDLTTIGSYGLLEAFNGCTGLTKISFPKLVLPNQGCMDNAFSSCSNVTEINFPELVTIPYRGLISSFRYTSLLDEVNFPKLTTIGESGLQSAFANSGLTTIDLSKVTSIGSIGLYYTFNNCTALISVNLSSLTSALYQALCYAFQNCSSLVSIDLSSLTSVADQALYGAFYGCTSLASLSFPALTSTGITGTYTFHGMLTGVIGCTVHFPSNLQSVIGSWTDVTSGFGGTNTTVLFDLPATN